MGPSVPRCLGEAVMEDRSDEHPMECGARIWEGAGAWVCFVGDRFGTSSLIRGAAGVPVTPTEPPAPRHGKVTLVDLCGTGTLSCCALPSCSMATCPIASVRDRRLTPPDHRSAKADIHTAELRLLHRSMRRLKDGFVRKY